MKLMCEFLFIISFNQCHQVCQINIAMSYDTEINNNFILDANIET